MSAADAWSRIARLRLRLRSHLQWYLHHYRGHPWWVLQDTASGQHYYFSPASYRLIGLLDGKRTLEQVSRVWGGRADGSVKDEIVALLIRLQAADLLQTEGSLDPAALFQRWQQRRHRLRRNTWMRPLAIRLPLFDPSRLLDAMLPLVWPLFGRLSLLFWLLIVGLAFLLGLQHSAALTDHAASRFLDPVNLLLLWLVYPVVKGLHELGHAFAIRIWGGRVRELGIMLLVFVPVPYVDGSAATAFTDKHRRILVGAAGIMVELLLTALALLLWLEVQPGILRDLAFNVMVIGGVSTLFFNGNPLLRFDGYYVLVDAIEIPNLATRTRQYYIYLARRYLIGMPEAVSPVIARGEPAWFLFYGLASAAYRVFISLAIALYVAGKFFVIGLLLAIWVVLSQLLLPVLELLHYLVRDPALRDHRSRAIVLSMGSVLVLTVLLWVVPLPSNTLAEGVLRMPEDSIIRAAGSGEVVDLLQQNGATVQPGDELLRLRDIELESRLRVLDARARELLGRLERAALSDRVEAGILRDQLDEVAAEKENVQRKLANLIVASPVTGTVDLWFSTDLPGRFIDQGQVLGVVRKDQVATARVVVPQAQASRVRDQTLRIAVRIAGKVTQQLPLSALHAVPAGTHRLPSAMLGSQAGGKIPVDARDVRGVTAVDPVFHFELAMPTVGHAYFPGTGVQVRFEHADEPLGPRWYRSIRQLLLARLGI